ncbi:hypothetical protein RRG08_028217 [Elysia crispata]|uniref:Phospholysine phosphohistidine inorganic pyrophosphate phosphatase n=1 Tax=Elysia crispata TaxID=231223 RepID=A0AAE0YD19_9GAST|nr:hypothetical protein RRG08_028217 [Elysia crispata]
MAAYFLDRKIKAVILDITGVLKESGRAINGSVDAVNRLLSSGLQVRFCTNETTVTRSELVRELQTLGFNVENVVVFPPIPAMCKILKERKLRPHLLVHPDAVSDFAEVDQNEPNCVVIGDATQQFTYENVNKAFQCLMRLDQPLLFSLGKGKYYQEHGELVLDAGAYMAALEYATDVKAQVVGKPSSIFFETVLQDACVSASEAVMVGDDIVSDIGGAQACGMAGVLVRTGKFRPRDENHKDVKPDAIVDNLAQFVDTLLSTLK